MATDKAVVDASSAVLASITDGWASISQYDLVAPSLIWSESAAGLRQLHYRGELSAAEASAALERLLTAPISIVDSHDVIAEAVELAAQLGWAKTYDAEFVVLARRLNAPLITVDARLAVTARRLVRVLPG